MIAHDDPHTMAVLQFYYYYVVSVLGIIWPYCLALRSVIGYHPLAILTIFTLLNWYYKLSICTVNSVVAGVSHVKS